MAVIFLFGIIFISAFCIIFRKPLKLLVWLIFNSLLGGLILAGINLVGGFAGISTVITPITAAFAGILGIPGVALVILLQYFL